MTLAGTNRLWNDDDRQTVANMLSEGASARLVGEALGLTRNAAIGRIARDPELHRLMRRSDPPKPGSYVPLHRSPMRAAPSLPPEEPPRAKPVPLIATGSRLCKWPIGFDLAAEGHYWCCGAQVKPGDIYCAFHRAKAKRPGT